MPEGIKTKMQSGHERLLLAGRFIFSDSSKNSPAAEKRKTKTQDQ